MSQPYFPATNKTGFFVFPFGFGVISGASGWFAFALTLAFLVIFFVFAILFTLGSFRFARSTVEYDRAVEELRLRYARGEITKEQFEQMLKDLKEHRYG
ncbi:hypothetical protein B9Q01_09140 [Candidatus Marsarchaeota G1 archaeon OSP_D]|uniref:SHOCT domain-containing protein n=3 Tax=Candidatus Marsarchaeota group 1 TaxID=2203770 RepID=A0A2R6ACI9_9ARCH|nr:MAG: hypothetical protein B9Q01_09140 [Candidatus Marsarchaeota G1 archaeon OSP_D]PSN84110.1 MAG: hypothetical protein B9Q02_09835 [Candidatus Marsarchaeota G1 archaeon BE_D]PSN87036.1 MAG: hypothetical protein B9Q00_09935 [Candidatus Marsarchaeota G1 archaeon OSP_C]